MNKKKPKTSRSQPLRVMCDLAKFCTSKTVESKLLFVNNPEFEERTLAFLAKYARKHQIELYAFALMGNHYHLESKFPKMNQDQFFMDFNSKMAQNVRMMVEEFEEGQVFRSRYSSQALPDNCDIEDMFFYCALQPVSSGLTMKVSEYPGYNSFNDAINERQVEYSYVNYTKYNKARSKNPHVSKYKFLETHVLEYARIPGYEDLSSRKYKSMMLTKLEERRVKIVKDPDHENACLTKQDLKKVKPGSKPKRTKKGGRRPLVLGRNVESRKTYLEFYFATVITYREASIKFRSGVMDQVFPPGTFCPAGVVFSPL